MNNLRNKIRNIIREIYMQEAGFPRALQIMRGGVDSIDKLVIITAANPMAQETEASVNNRKMEELYSDIKSLNYGFIKLKGLYGVPEPSVLVNGMTKGEGMALAKKYKQLSYIFGYRKQLDDNNSVMMFELIYPWNSSLNMTSRMTISNSDVQNFEDFYSKVKGRKFQIPFYDEMLQSKQMMIGSSKPVDIEPKDEPDDEQMNYRQKTSLKGKASKPYRDLEKQQFGNKYDKSTFTFDDDL